jgi:hypothetical protein
MISQVHKELTYQHAGHGYNPLLDPVATGNPVLDDAVIVKQPKDAPPQQDF